MRCFRKQQPTQSSTLLRQMGLFRVGHSMQTFEVPGDLSRKNERFQHTTLMVIVVNALWTDREARHS